MRRPRKSTLFPYTTLFRSVHLSRRVGCAARARQHDGAIEVARRLPRHLRQLPLQRLELPGRRASRSARSEEHTSELQSQSNLVCRLLLEKKKVSATVDGAC